VFESFQAKIFRLYQSITATRYRKPLRMGRYVMSIVQTWFGRSIVNSTSPRKLVTERSRV
jgi:hypothetical protein